MSSPRKTITFSRLKRLSVVNSEELTGFFQMGNNRFRWVGIGFVDEGFADGTETLVTNDDDSVPKAKQKRGKHE